MGFGQHEGFTSSFESKVSEAVTTSTAVGASLPEGLGSLKLTGTNSTSSGSSWKVNYKNEEELKQETSQTSEVFLENNPKEFHVLGAMDTTFGNTFLFRLIPNETEQLPPVPSKLHLKKKELANSHER